MFLFLKVHFFFFSTPGVAMMFHQYEFLMGKDYATQTLHNNAKLLFFYKKTVEKKGFIASFHLFLCSKHYKSGKTFAFSYIITIFAPRVTIKTRTCRQ